MADPGPARSNYPTALTKREQEGDLLWTDFGITYLRLNTDTQQNAFVLRDGETAAPAGLVAGLVANNRVQDALTDAYAVGRSGNEVLAPARAKAIAAEGAK